jgi:hypothetical protein
MAKKSLFFVAILVQALGATPAYPHWPAIFTA